MDVVLIPFFLAANIPLTEKWAYGPEFIFHLNMSVLYYADVTSEPIGNLNFTIVSKCRPKSEDSLLCDLPNVLWDIMFGSMRISIKVKFEEALQIKFNRQGIESIGIPNYWISAFGSGIKYRIATIFANRFSHSIYPIRSLSGQVEVVTKVLHGARAKCDATLKVSHDDKSSGRIPDVSGEERSYTLNVPWLSTWKPGSTIVIEKKVMAERCSYQPGPPGSNFQLGKLIEKTQITEAGMFKTQTEMQGTTDHSMFVVNSVIELKDIVPATEVLQSIPPDSLTVVSYPFKKYQKHAQYPHVHELQNVTVKGESVETTADKMQKMFEF